MKFGKIDTDKKIFIVAEIGNNHEGNFRVAKKMINEASAAGVDAVKFQTFIPEHFVSYEDQSRLKRLKDFQLSYKQFRELSKIAKKKKGLIFFSTPLDIKSAKFLNTIQPVFKISSGDNNFYPLINTIAKFGKPMIISTGAADIDDIKKVYEKISKIWSLKKKYQNLGFLHCVSSYPVPNEQTNLATITYLKKMFPKIVVGYSDHTLGIDAAVLSVIAGARIIEKHFTLDKNFSDFRDHKLSANPEELRLMVKKIRNADKLLGREEKKQQKCEIEMKNVGRRSIAAAYNLLKGNKLSESDLIWVRPGKGFSPGEEKKVLGKTILRNLKIGQIIKKSDIK